MRMMRGRWWWRRVRVGRRIRMMGRGRLGVKRRVVLSMAAVWYCGTTEDGIVVLVRMVWWYWQGWYSGTRE